ncbi:MAG: hypothetical protein V4695_08930 [Pseudomonadota bacterium]
MAATKLRLKNTIVYSLIAGISLILFLTWQNGTAAQVGMTLDFESSGRPVMVKRFDPDGERGPTPGYIGGPMPKYGAHMSFMPGDSKKALPRFVDVTWISYLPEFEAISKEYEKIYKEDRVTPEVQKEFRLEVAKNPVYTQRVDLTPILTPELIAKVRADKDNTQLHLNIRFDDKTVSITAKAEKWR